MPTVPRLTPQVTPRPLAAARLTAAPFAPQTAASLGAGVDEAIANAGETAARIGTSGLAQIWQQRRDRADQAAVLGSERQLGELEHRLLTDPQTGAYTVTGKDTLQLYDRIGDAYDEAAGTIEAGLTNDRQRLAFAQARDTRRRSLLSTLDGYVLREMDNYEKGEAQASLQTAINLGIANAGNAPRIREELDRIDTIVDQYAGRLGLTGPEAKAAYVGELKGKLHEGVITQLLAQDRDQDAVAYYDAAKEEIPGGQRLAIEAKLETSSTDATGLRTASAIWDALAPTDDQAPINFDAMEAEARARAGDNPKVYKATLAYLRERYSDTVTGRKERLDARDDAVWTQVLNGRPFSAVRTMPEFVALEGKDQATIRDYYTRQSEHAANVAYLNESRAAARENRAYTAQLREQHLLEVNGWSRYFELSDPATLRSLSRADILRELPTLGEAHVNRLLTDQEQLSRNDAALKAATIDKDEFTTIATEAGIDYAAAPKTVAEKANIAQLYDRVKDEIATQQGAKGRLLTREEKQTVMQNLVDQKVRIADWFTDTRTFGAAVAPSERGAAYVPLPDVDANPRVYGQMYTQALNYLRSLTGNQTLSDAQLRERFGSRIEKALGRRVAGASRAEIENALKGVD